MIACTFLSISRSYLGKIPSRLKAQCFVPFILGTSMVLFRARYSSGPRHDLVTFLPWLLEVNSLLFWFLQLNRPWKIYLYLVSPEMNLVALKCGNLMVPTYKVVIVSWKHAVHVTPALQLDVVEVEQASKRVSASHQGQIPIYPVAQSRKLHIGSRCSSKMDWFWRSVNARAKYIWIDMPSTTSGI